MLQIEKVLTEINKLKSDIKIFFISSNIPYNIEDNYSEKIKLVFVGPYSAGKSSILKLLTGKKDIAIGAEITTQKANSYIWNGINVVDTPGIHTKLRPDHDEISYSEIASADLLIFVITNELFDNYMAEHFRKLAIEHDKASEMILVVNKMDRTSKGNSLEQQNIIRQDIQKVITPYTPEQLHLCFLDTDSYFGSLEVKNTDQELSTSLLAESGYNDFINTINQFVQEKGLTSKLTTNLYQIDDILEKNIQKRQSKSTSTISAFEEHLRQQRNLLVESRNSLQLKIHNIFTNVASEIRNIGLDAANIIVTGCKPEDVEKELQESINKVNQIIDNCQIDANDLVAKSFTQIGQDLEEKENSQFAAKIKISLSEEYNKLPKKIQDMIKSAPDNIKHAGNQIWNAAHKVGCAGGIKLSDFSGSQLNKAVVNVGHAIGYKFKPWQAVKFTKNIAIAGQVLSIFGVVFSIGMQIKSDIDEKKEYTELQNNRQNVRSQFNLAAKELEDYGEQFIKIYVMQPIDESISEISDKIFTITENNNLNNNECLKMQQFQVRCKNLITEIHNLK